MVRATTLDDLDDVRLRVTRCFEAGALATGATLEVEYLPRYGQMVHDPDLVAIYRAAAESLGRDFASDGGAEASRPTWATCRWRCRRSTRASASTPAARRTTSPSSRPPARVRPRTRGARCAKALALTAVGAATDARARGRLLALREERVAAAVDRAEAPI
jgi:hypothetical protein